MAIKRRRKFRSRFQHRNLTHLLVGHTSAVQAAVIGITCFFILCSGYLKELENSLGRQFYILNFRRRFCLSFSIKERCEIMDDADEIGKIIVKSLFAITKESNPAINTHISDLKIWQKLAWFKTLPK